MSATKSIETKAAEEESKSYDKPNYLSYSEAADYLNCSPQHLRKMVMRDRVPHVKFFGARGRVWFIEEDLRTFVMSSGNRQELLQNKVPATA